MNTPRTTSKLRSGRGLDAGDAGVLGKGLREHDAHGSAAGDGGLTAPSLYAAFGSKEALFREVVLLYHQTHGIPMAKALTEGATARASIEGLLRVAATTFCQPDTPADAIGSGAMNCMPENQGVQDYLRKLRLLRQKMIRQRLKRGIAEGDVRGART